MGISLKFSHQAVLLIAVPLLFELVFVSVLVNALRQLEYEYAREAKSTDLLASLDKELVNVIAAAGAVGMYQTTREARFKEQGRQAARRARAEQPVLSALATEIQRHDIDAFNTLNNEAINTLTECSNLLEQGHPVDQIRTMVRAQRLLTKVNETGWRIVESQQEFQRRQREAQAGWRQAIETIIAAGVGFNIALAGFLAWYFNRVTVRRLSVLRENSLNLAVSKPLREPLSGSDDIAQIDQVFHSMAEALREAQLKEQALTKNAADVICSLDEQGRFVLVNPAVDQLWGYAAEDLQGKSIYAIVPEVEVEATRRSIQNLIDGKTSASFENRVKRKNGTLGDVLWSAHWSPEQKSLFCVAHDISERKEAERLKQEVMAMVSHDLRSPLTSLKLGLEILLEGSTGELSPRGRTIVSHANSSVVRLINTINDLLYVDKLESGVFELHLEECDGLELLTSAVDSIESLAENEKINIELCQKSLPVLCDAERIERVLVNLLSNAIKFSPPGSTIRLTLERSPESVEFSVADEGRGIPKEKIGSIFERYRQVERGDERGSRGSGLGLAICKALIEAHSGEIGVESVIDKGSRFWFRLPTMTTSASQKE